MDSLPRSIVRVLRRFEAEFTAPTWRSACTLVVGALLAPGGRTVASALRVVGLARDPHFVNYHRVLNRARWSPRALGRRLLLTLVAAFVPADAPVVVGIDETIERRRGAKIAAKGIYRDPVRSSRSHVVKASGLRWISMQLLAPIPWARRIWGLPFLTVLAPSERFNATRHRRHKTIPEWARQMVRQLRRWLPGRTLVVVGDSSYAVLELLHDAATLPEPVTMVTRLRLDAALYDPPPKRTARTIGRPRVKGPRQPTLAVRVTDPGIVWETIEVPWYGDTPRGVEVATGTALWCNRASPPVPLRWVLLRDSQGRFEPQALLSTDPTADPAQIIAWFVARWPLEVTFREARDHLGLETQRQWSDAAIARTTPALLGLVSLVALMARESLGDDELPAVRAAAWYPKATPTFADTLACMRQQLWPARLFSTSPSESDVLEIPRDLLDRLTATLAYAA